MWGRRKKKRTWRKLLALFLGLLLVYILFVEHGMIVISQEIIKSERISEQADGLKIVQIADTHLGFGENLRNLRQAAQKINEMNCDLIVFCGDLFDNYADNDQDRAEAVAILSSLQARLGKFAVYGNHDYGGGAKKAFRETMEAAGFTVLVQESHYFAEEKINLIGLDDYIFGHHVGPLTQDLFVPEDAYQILLCHEPDKADEFRQYPIDLQLSGHSHGGQVQLPFYGAVVLPPLGETYYDGFYQIKEGERPYTLYVNRGLGTTKVNLRFMAPPQITVFTLQQVK